MPTTDELAAIVDRMPDLDKGGKGGGAKGKLTGPPWPTAIREVFDPVLAGGADAVLGLIDMLKEVDDGTDYKVRYALHGLALYACRPGKEKARAAVLEAMTKALGQDRPKPVKRFLVWELETVGDGRAVGALARLLPAPDLGPDVVRALVAIAGLPAGGPAREPVLEALRTALASARGPMRLHLVQALGVLKDTASAPALREAARAKEPGVRLAAVEALAALGDPGAADLCLAAVRARGWERIKAAKACLLLAENLARAGRKADAARLYDRLEALCAEPAEAYLREACRRGRAGLA